MRMFNMNVDEDIEFLEYVIISEMGLNLDKSIFSSKDNVFVFYNACSDTLNKMGIVADGDVVVVMDWTLLQLYYFFLNADLRMYGDSFFWVE